MFPYLLFYFQTKVRITLIILLKSSPRSRQWRLFWHLTSFLFTLVWYFKIFFQFLQYWCYKPIFILTSYYTPAQRSWRGGILDSPCPSVCPSVCRRHGFRSISQVCFGISISNFICMFMVAIGRSLLIFSDVTDKMAAWRPYWIFWFSDSNLTLALNINFKLQRHNTYVYG